ncbi:MAG: aldehyde dehydrogenase family protein [Pseudomonadota bacterium]
MRKKNMWESIRLEQRANLLDEIVFSTNAIAEAWAEKSSRSKRIPAGSHLEGEEWLTGPYALIKYCKALATSLRQVSSGKPNSNRDVRELPNGQVACRVFPKTVFDKVLQSGIKVDVWMEPHVAKDSFDVSVATQIRKPAGSNVSVVLGAGNVSSIAPLDCLYKLFFDNEVCCLKLNPVNSYLRAYFEAALRPLTELGVLSIVEGDAKVGDYLCRHKTVGSLFITGSQKVHDTIVWGEGKDGKDNKTKNRPRNPRPIKSELGGVSPTIVVPGPWTDKDIKYHSYQIATQKLENEGHMCVASQVLVLPKDWEKTFDLVDAIALAMFDSEQRPAYYPGSEKRARKLFANKAALKVKRQDKNSLRSIVEFDSEAPSDFEQFEVFAPVLTATRLESKDAISFLNSAIRYANERLYGSLAANIVIHPKTVKQIGKAKLEEILADLHYGTIAINTWSGSAFTMPNAAWGAFPGKDLQNVESGIGKVHNASLFDYPERTVVWAPFHQWPLPPWFVNHRSGKIVAKALTRFEATGSPIQLAKLIFASFFP